MNVRTGLLAVLFFIPAACALAAHTQARLILDATVARPGDTLMAGVQLHMEPGWHTYWRNPGQEGGLPTTIKWELPSGITAGPIQWPLPEKSKSIAPAVGNQPAAETINYVYSDEVILLVPLKLAADMKPGTVTIKADVSWLECATKCIPGDATVQTELQIGSSTEASPDKALIAQWQNKVPKSGGSLKAHAFWATPTSGTTWPLIIQWTSTGQSKDADFYPDKSDDFEIEPQMHRLPGESGEVRLQAQVTKSGDKWPKQISGVALDGTNRAFEVTADIGANDTIQAPSAGGRSIWKVFVSAFLGGLILNIMPCVLPVIALKILGFVTEAAQEPRRVRKLGLIYTGGVLSSFLLLGVVIAGLHAAGDEAGWGLQFSNPYFVVAMAVLVTLIALNLFGVFEVTVGSSTLSAAAGLASKTGGAGAFFNGFLATVLATSCSAPILAVATGYVSSLKNSAVVVVLIMVTMGLGLAFPYILLSWQPAWLRFLPKPGQWMQRFKVAMGFPMAAAAVWLCSLGRIHYGDRAWWIAMFLVFISVAAWVYGEFVQRGSARRPLALAVCVALIFGGYAFALEKEMRWREPLDEVAIAAQQSRVAPRGVNWENWSSEAVNAAREAGRPVVVDFTATWCPTCNTIVKPSFESASVQKKLKEINALALVADYSRRPKNITEELRRFERGAVPLVVVYPRRPEQPPLVFDLVTPGTLLDALDKAAQ